MSWHIQHNKLTREGIPLPESWGWEWEYLVAQLFDYLDICKMYDCLLVSTNLSNIRLEHGATCKGFQQYVILGSRTFHKFLLEKYPIQTEPNVFFQTPTMIAMIYACCVDDVTLGHVFDILRIAELLENHIAPLTVREKAKVICAIIGELYTTLSRLKNSGNLSKGRNQEFLEETLGYLLDLLTDTGRDRATYIKERYTRIPIVPPFVSKRQPRRAESNQEELEHSILESAQVDSHLYNSILSGSLSSIWNRVEQLWSVTGFRSGMQRDATSALYQGVYNKMVSSFCQATKQLKRYRRLLLIRFLEMLCSSAHDQSRLPQLFSYPPKDLVTAVVEGFLRGASGFPFPYESECQKKRILTSSLIPAPLVEELTTILVLQDSLHFMYDEEIDSESSATMPLLIAQRHRSIDRALFSDALKHLLP